MGEALYSSVFAYHGQYSSGKALAKDMNNPKWVDSYPNYEIDYPELQVAYLPKIHPVILIGYSLGGDLITRMIEQVETKVVAVVLYEAPNLQDITPPGNFPVLWITNDYLTTRRRRKELEDTLLQWDQNHEVTTMKGKGRHIRFSFTYPYIHHGWDVSLNDAIHQWLRMKESESGMIRV